MLFAFCRRPLNYQIFRGYASGKTVKPTKFKKVLVANRGEIAIRVFRALREMNINSVALFAHADRHSMHRYKADEAYEVGAGKEPVAAYLDVEDVVRIAKNHNVDAIHPGYGFLSERSDFAEMVEKAGIRFIGPSADVMARMGDKVAARKSAIEAGVKVVPGTDFPITTAEEAEKFVTEHGTPIILKAAYGGGGRGMRRVDDVKEVKEAFEMASREALANFGNGAMFVEKFVLHPRHIEVQLMGDHHGNIMHLYERDCSVQRRHQKVVEIAPAPDLDPKVRDNLLKDAVKLAKHVGYQNAGTVEFLLDERGEHFFIEVNARLQVEHTVTEEITGVDLVQTQVRVAEGQSLSDLGLSQDMIKVHGAAIQCRLTTEDPAKGFQPDSGRLEIIAHSSNHLTTAQKLKRALEESRFRGVKVNKPFLLAVLSHPDFLNGAVDTSFIDKNPQLFDVVPTRNRGQRLLQYLSEVKVNGSLTPLATELQPARIKPAAPMEPIAKAPPAGWKQVLKEKGPEGFAKAIRNHKGLLITDTTFRDAHQSLLATRVRTTDLLKAAPHVAHNMSQLLSLENWGGATFDVCMQFLRECPWERLEQIRKEVPNVPFQCLLRGANAMGYSNYPDNVIHEFCRLSVQSGMDIFRVFDCFNYLPNLQLGCEAVGKAGGVVEASMAYTGDITDPKREKYSLKYYLNLADELVKTGIHILAIKDMAGILKPEAATLLIGELRAKHPNLPIVVHTHDTAGVGVASMLAAAEAGADAVDAAIDSMSGMTAQPSLGAISNCVRGTKLDTGLSQKALSAYNMYWEQTRRLYAPFECTTTMKSGNADVFRHEIPGGQYTNLQFQSYSLNLADQFDKVTGNYAEANKALGDLIKVTPSSKVVGDLAQVMTQQGISSAEELLEKADSLTFPNSVQDFFEGKLGQTPYGFPTELQNKVLRGKSQMTGRPGATLPPLDLKALKKKLEEKHDMGLSFGPVDKLPTDAYFAGPKELEEISIELETGKTLLVRLMGVGPVLEGGRREVYFEFNGQYRTIEVQDKEASKDLTIRPKAKSDDTSHVGAPMKGNILEVKVKAGDKVSEKQTVCVLSAMKMEMAVEAKTAGVVSEITVKTGDAVDAEDLLIVIDPE